MLFVPHLYIIFKIRQYLKMNTNRFIFELLLNFTYICFCLKTKVTPDFITKNALNGLKKNVSPFFML